MMLPTQKASRIKTQGMLRIRKRSKTSVDKIIIFKMRKLISKLMIMKMESRK